MEFCSRSKQAVVVMPSSDPLSEQVSAMQSPAPSQAPAVNRFVRDVGLYSASSIATIILGFVQALVIPVYLTIEQFGYWRLFILYLGYAGFLNFGFIDGVLIRWAGMKSTEAQTEAKTALLYLLFQQASVLLPLALIVVTFGSGINTLFLMWLLLGLFVTSLMNLGKTTLLATLLLKRLSLANAINTGVFLVGILIIAIFKQWDLSTLIILQIVSVLIAILIMFDKKTLLNEMRWPSLKKVFGFGLRNTRLGFFVLLGNGGLILAYTIDRLVVSWTSSIEQFAVYSFAVAFVALIYRVVGTIADVVFPYLMQMSSSQQNLTYGRSKRIVIAISGISFVTYFPVHYAVMRFLPQYSHSLPVTKILLMGTTIGAVLRMIQVNYFKMRQEQQLFFRFALFANGLFFLLALLVSRWNQLAWFSVVAVVANFAWYIMNDLHLCQRMNIDIREQIREIGMLFVFWVSFLILSSLSYLLWFWGVLYFWASIMLAVFLLWNDREWLAAVTTSLLPFRRSYP